MSAKKNSILVGSPLSKYLLYSVPWAFSMLAAGSAAIVDGVFVGRYAGAQALAALNLIVPIWSFLYSMGVMFAAGGAAMAGNSLGGGNREAASAMLIQILATVMLISIIFQGCAFYMEDGLLAFLGANDELREDCRVYLRTLLYFAPVFPLGVTLSYFARVDQSPVLASAGYIVCAAVNVVMDAWFIAGLGMGLKGAAYATGMAYCVPCLIYIIHFLSPKSSYRVPRSLGKISELMKAAWNGFSEFVNEISAGAIILCFNLILMERMGAEGVAAFTVFGYVALLAGLAGYGFADSLAALVSVCQGAGKKRRMGAFLVRALSVEAFLGFILVLSITFFPNMIIGIFLPQDAGARDIAAGFLGGGRWAFLFTGMTMALASYFTGRLWAASSFFVAFCRSLAFPLLLLWLLPSFFGDRGLFYVASAAEGMAFFVAAAIFAYGTRKQKVSRVNSRKNAL